MLKERECKSNYLQKSLEDLYLEEKQKQLLEKPRSNYNKRQYNYLKHRNTKKSKILF